MSETKATVTEYDGGTNAVIEHEGRAVSATKTSNGLYDVQGDNGKTLYTGKDLDNASKASQDYLKGGN